MSILSGLTPFFAFFVAMRLMSPLTGLAAGYFGPWVSVSLPSPPVGRR